MARYYYRRSIWGRILVVLAAIPVIAYLANLTYRWLLPFVPLAGAGVVLILLCWAGFRRRRY
jgi:cell division protein FtsW (lipid II flippase)